MTFNFLQPTFLIKLITLIVVGFYVIFTLIIFTQIKAMSEIIGIPRASGIFKIVSIINIILAISLFLFALVIL